MLDQRVIEALRVVGLDEAVFRFGLSGTLDAARAVEIESDIVEARSYIHAMLADAGDSALIETFDPERYNRNATLGENLIFGLPVGQTTSTPPCCSAPRSAS